MDKILRIAEFLDFSHWLLSFWTFPIVWCSEEHNISETYDFLKFKSIVLIHHHQNPLEETEYYKNHFRYCFFIKLFSSCYLSSFCPLLHFFCSTVLTVICWKSSNVMPNFFSCLIKFLCSAFLVMHTSSLHHNSVTVLPTCRIWTPDSENEDHGFLRCDAM